jgi:hypothetical protein
MDVDGRTIGGGVAEPASRQVGVWWVVGMALAGGAIAGLLLIGLTALVARSSIEGDGWSLSGNGALIVPIIGLPIVLAGGWVTMAAWFARWRGWWVAGLTTGLAVAILPWAGYLALSTVGGIVTLLVCAVLVGRPLMQAAKVGRGGPLTLACIALVMGTLIGLLLGISVQLV